MIGKPQFASINKKLSNLIDEKAFLIVAHRGQWGGNIIENTINAGKVAFRGGSEIIEIDVCRSSDGKFFSFHTGNETHLLGNENYDLEKMTFAEIQKIPLLNSIGAVTEQRFELIADILMQSPQELIFQIDRSWPYWDDFLPFLSQFNDDIKQRMMIKSPYSDTLVTELVNSASDLMFLPFIGTRAEFDKVVAIDAINLIGIEILASHEKDELYGKTFIEELHERRLIAQINAIRLNDNRKLYAGYDDSISLLEHPDKGWGMLYEMGVDLIQTDWVPQLDYYRRNL